MSECFRLTDWSAAANVLSQCWDEHAEDGASLSPPNVINEYWLGFLEKDSLAGIVRVYAVTSVLYEVHICILKEFRDKSIEYALSAYSWMLEHLPNLNKLVGNIPECNQRAIQFTKKIGMKEQGINSDSWVKNNEVYSMIQLGITRKEMEGLCLPHSQS